MAKKEKPAVPKIDVAALRKHASDVIAASGDLVEKLRDENELTVTKEPGELSEDAIAKVTTSPIARGAVVARKFVETMLGETPIGSYVRRLTVQAEAVGKGDLSALESMLTTQATTLDAIFNNMASRASNASLAQTMELLLRTALKAQAQCRSTVEAIAEIRNPRQIAFIKQQNNARGHQQVNNGVPAAPVARAHEEWSDQSNELLEGEGHGTTLDGRAAGPAVRSDQAVEAVGAIHGTEDRYGESDRVGQRAKARPTVSGMAGGSEAHHRTAAPVPRAAKADLSAIRTSRKTVTRTAAKATGVTHD